MKKIIIFIFIFFSFITNTKAESIKVSNYEELSKAFNNFDSEIEIELTQDIYINNKITLSNDKKITINGKKHKLYRNANYLGGYFIIPATSTLLLNEITFDGLANDWKLDYNSIIKTNQSDYEKYEIINENKMRATESIIVNQGILTIKNCEFFDNNSSAFGSIVRNSGTLKISSSKFEHNLSGSIGKYNNGIIHSSGGTTEISSTTFQNNCSGFSYYSVDTNGSIITIVDSEKLTIGENTVFIENISQEGGGALTIKNSISEISDTIFENNVSTDDGGAIFIKEETEKKFETYNHIFKNVTFKGNKAGLDLKQMDATAGGAILIYGKEVSFSKDVHHPIYKEFLLKDEIQYNILMENCIFEENSSPAGGALYIYGQYNIEISKSTFKKNKTTNNGDGGAIYSKSAIIEMKDSIIEENEAKNGSFAAFGNYTSLTLDNTIIKNNINKGSGTIVNISYELNNEKYSTILLKNNTTITGNTADEYGGGIFLFNPYGNGSILRIDETSKIYNNKAIKGGDDIVQYNVQPIKDNYKNHSFITLNDSSLLNMEGINGWYYDFEGQRYADQQTPQKFDDVTEYRETIFLKNAGQTELSYDLNGGISDIEYPKEIIKYGDNIVVIKDEPNMKYNTFIGWNTKKDGSGKWLYSGDKYNGEYGAVLYAQYKSIETKNPETMDKIIIVITIFICYLIRFISKKDKT